MAKFFHLLRLSANSRASGHIAMAKKAIVNVVLLLFSHAWDFEGTDSVKLDFSGHSSIKIMKVYDRKNDAVERASLDHKMRLK
jgi:hypothetical protein